MNSVIAKTFGGLSKPYYFRHLVFGLAFVALIIFVASRSPRGVPIAMVLLMSVNALLYPYARFVYESVVDFILGDNVFIVNAVFMLFVKALTMLLCFMFAIFIAPIGLAYLYYHHSKK